MSVWQSKKVTTPHRVPHPQLCLTLPDSWDDPPTLDLPSLAWPPVDWYFSFPCFAVFIKPNKMVLNGGIREGFRICLHEMRQEVLPFVFLTYSSRKPSKYRKGTHAVWKARSTSGRYYSFRLANLLSKPRTQAESW